MQKNGAARASRLTRDARDGVFMRFIYEDAKTLYEVFRRGVKESNNGNCLGWRDDYGTYVWLSYNETLLRAKNFGAGLVASGLKPGEGSHLSCTPQEKKLG